MIQAYSNIIEILCENFEEYSKSETKRDVTQKRPKKKNIFSIKVPPKKKRKKGKKKGKKRNNYSINNLTL